MNRAPRSRAAALAHLGDALFDELWLVAQGNDRGALDTPWLEGDTLNTLKHAHPADRALYWPEFKEAQGDRARLAALHLKLLYAYLGRDAMDESLNTADRKDAFSQLRARVKTDDFVEIWNQPRLSGLCTRARAKRLAADGYGEPGSLERRVRRLRSRGWHLGNASLSSRKK